MVTGRGPALGQHLRQGGLGLLHAAGQPVGQGQQPAGPQARPALLLGDVGQCLPGEPGRLRGSKAQSACSSRRSTASKALTPSIQPTAHHVTQSDC